MKQLRSLPLLIVVAVVSLVLGSVGTATAGAGLTKGKVKKIAAKVVTKAAPDLSVAKATTADNALTLAGQPPTAYQDQVAVYTASVGTPVLEEEWTLPLTPGVYHVSYSAYLNGSGGVDGSDTGCDIYSLPVTNFYADDASFAEGSSAHSASAVLTVTAGQTYILECFSDETWTTLGTEPVQVVVNRLDGATSGTLTEAPPRPATGARGR